MTPHKRFRILIQRLFQDTTKWQGLFLVTNHVRGDKEEAFFWSLQRKKKQMCKNEPFQFKILVAALAGQISFSLK
jgi:hypothetical protein